MRKVNYLYYIFLIVLIPFWDKVLGAVSEAWIFLFFLLCMYYTFSQNIFFAISKRKLNKKYAQCEKLRADTAMYWLDSANRQIVIVCLFNPFKAQYISLDDVGECRLKIKKKRNEKYAEIIHFVIQIKGKRYKTIIASAGRSYGIDLEGYGREYIESAENFITRIKQAR